MATDLTVAVYDEDHNLNLYAGNPLNSTILPATIEEELPIRVQDDVEYVARLEEELAESCEEDWEEPSKDEAEIQDVSAILPSAMYISDLGDLLSDASAVP